ncbi:hypothetical protein [Roseateles terrae]|uniref:Type 4 fimbrial biogenesis protein PilX N-terminal domain-containing protein n=1 Tax=Roseateles terrae TaxID=431060 RepID=A0ABR6GLL5_9BURK|nr:hypothetical protein [Roseateles terrae]MBB3192996.1 hypothetical protein [Roseateles terrae]OWQ89759.1 hypothetical protein CDN98_04395 [Roseateles terrae]
MSRHALDGSAHAGRIQTGGATLLMCSLLMMLLAMAVLWTARPLAAAQRVAANDQRLAMAVQAADAGLAWATAMLNTGRVDDNCRPTFDEGQDFRTRALRVDEAGQPIAAAPTRWLATCTHDGSQRWQCRCGDTSGASPMADVSVPVPTASDLATTFGIRLADADVPGQFTLFSRGCGGASTQCLLSDPPPQDGTGISEHIQHLALLSALRRPPATPLVAGPQAFVRVFGIPAGQYQLQPAMTRLRCTDQCVPEIRQALARGRRLIWIDGSVTLREPLPDSPDGAPLMLLVDGQLDINTAMSFSGILYARTGIEWAAPPGSRSTVKGALVTDGQLTLGGDPDGLRLEADPALLRQIHLQMGSYLPVPGGWSHSR